MSSYQLLDPRLITINRETRQRQEGISDIEDLMQSIKSIGIINPIVVRQEGEVTYLVAGERRLQSALALAKEEVPVIYFEDLSEEDAEIIELEENVKRKELAWKDQVKAVARIHALYRKANNGWKIEQTAEAISLHHSQVRKILHVQEAIVSGRITKAEGIEQAYNTLQKFTERKAESIVGDLIVKGAAIFGNMDASTLQQENDFVTVTSVAIATEDNTNTDRFHIQQHALAIAHSTKTRSSHHSPFRPGDLCRLQRLGQSL